MRALGSSLVLLGVVVGLAFGCGESEGDSDTPAAAGSVTATAGSSNAGNTSGGSGNPTGGSSSAAGSSSSEAGTNSSAGSASSGGATGGGSAAGGQPDAPGGDSAGGASGGLVDCDPSKILCKRLAPICEAGEVPSVAGSCYGDCVKIERCACSAAEQCPEPEQYTCWAKQHCGPYVR